MKFIGRTKELALLGALTSKKTASLVVLRGRRRIGKSRLASELGKSLNINTYVFSGLPPEKNVTAKLQREDFAHQLQRQLQIPSPKAEDWGDLFWHLADKTKQGRVLIIIDEITWLGDQDVTFLGKLKTAWDLYFKNNPKLLLILSGSVSSWIEKNILASTGFLGRISIDLLLEELPLYQCTEFWGKYKQHTSAYDMLKIFSITGGIPRYLEEVYPDQSATNNIQRLCFNRNGFLFKEFDKIFSDLFDARSEKYKIIVRKLAHGHATLEEIYAALETEKTGVVTDYVVDLIAAGFVSRDFTWNIKDGKDSKLSVLRLKDNYLRFYLRYIEPNKERIARDTIGVPQQLSSILGLQFENLVLANRKTIYKLLSLDPSNIIVDNPFFQRKTARQQGCQIDYMIQTCDDMLYLCEIKFNKNKLGLEVMHAMQQKLDQISVPKHFSKRAVLIHVNGITADLEETEFFAKIISFADLFMTQTSSLRESHF